jgi:hypothetical protein
VGLIEAFTLFLVCLYIGSESPRIGSSTLALAILLFSLAYLYALGPSAIGFGLAIGSGWILLNEMVERATPLR